MLTQHIALVPEADGIDLSDLARVSAALQKQVTRDLSPAWGVTATVDAFPRLEDVPVGYWPILVTRCDLGIDGGVHLDRDGAPYAQVEASAEWSLDASRACLEMLVNPFGRRTVSAPSPRSDQGRVEVVVEVCGPCSDALCAYTIDDVLVSDFCLPSFYEDGPAGAGKRLSMNGSVGAPLRVLAGGHMTWLDLASQSYWRRSHWGDNPIDTRLGELPHAGASSRDLAPRSVPLQLRNGSPAHEALLLRVELDRAHARRISELRALRLRASLVEASRAITPHSVIAPVPAPAPKPSALLTQDAGEAEHVTSFDVIDETTTPHTSSAPPPLPSRAPTLSTAPVSVVRPPDTYAERAPVWMALGILVAVAGVMFVVHSNERAQLRSPKDRAITVQAAAEPPPVSAAPPATVEPAAIAEPAAVIEPEAEAAAAEPPIAKKRKHERSKKELAPSRPPEPVEPEGAVKPSAPERPALAVTAAPQAPVSIDDLIDTRR